MKTIQILTLLSFWVIGARADSKYHPITLSLTTEKESYYEGEKVTFLITLTNTDKERAYPVLVPGNKPTGRKLYCLNVYDKANNTLLLRYAEDPNMHMQVQDSGTVSVRYLQPGEHLVIPIYWNDDTNKYRTEVSSHHSFGLPVFAGMYKVNVCYNPNGTTEGDSIYAYYNDTETEIPADKLAMPGNGDQSNFCTLRIRKSPKKDITIEGVTYYTQQDSERQFWWYYTDSIGNGGTNTRLVHLTNLPIDSFTLRSNEYYYSHFTDKYGTYIKRFDDGDVQEYRRYTDYCPEELLTERYNDQKQKIYYATKLPDGRYYNVRYHQPGGKKEQEMYYLPNGTKCETITYIYNKAGEFVKTKTSFTTPCTYNLETGKSYRLTTEL